VAVSALASVVSSVLASSAFTAALRIWAADLLEPSKSAAASFTNETDSDDLPLRRISISTAFRRGGAAAM